MELQGIERRKLTEKCYNHAEKTLGESDDVREESIREIQDWLEENPTINAHRHVDYILYFLRRSKFNIEDTKRKIER